MKLDHGQLHLLRLVASAPKNASWATISNPVWILFDQEIPAELYETKVEEKQRYIRLTEKGQTVVDYS